MTDIFKPRVLQFTRPPRILVGVGGTGSTSVDTVAREAAAAAQDSVDAITAQAGEVIAADQGVLSSDGKQFLNQTGSDVTLTGASSAELAVDGLSAVTGTTPLASNVSDGLMSSSDKVKSDHTPFTFDSISDLDSSNDVAVGDIAVVGGYYTKGDGGGNKFEIVAAGTGPADGGAFIELTASGLQAKGLFEDGCRFEHWGTVKDGSTNDAPMIQAALDWCAANGIRYLRASGLSGQFAISGQVYMQKLVYLDFRYSSMVPLSDDAGFVLSQLSGIENLNWSAAARQTWVGPMLLANDVTNSSIGAFPRLKNIACEGYDDDIGNVVNGVMLKLDASAGTRITGLRASGLYASFLDNVVEFKSSDQALSGWVNSNHLEFDMIYNCRTCFTMNRLTSDHSCSNNYIKASYQPGPTEQAGVLICNGENNEFDFLIWDMAGADPFIIDFGADASDNQVTGSFDPNGVRDLNVSSRRNHIQTRTFPTIPFSKMAVEPATSSSGLFLGQVDNCLSYADKRFNVTAPSVTLGSLSAAFSPNNNSRAFWSNLTSLVIEIDLLASYSALRTLGVAFGDTFVPDTVTFETSSDGASWNEVVSLPGSFLTTWSSRGFVGGSFQYIRLTLTSAVAQDFSIAQIFGWWKGQAQGAYLPTGGGKLVGDTTFASGKSALFASSNGYGEGGINVDNSNRLAVSATGGVKLNGVRILGDQQPAVADPTGGSVVDTECRAALIALADRIRNHGLIGI